MNPFTKTVAAYRSHKERQAFLKYESRKNAGRQMVQDAFGFFPNRREALDAMKLIMASNQTPAENNDLSNWFGGLAHEQERN